MTTAHLIGGKYALLRKIATGGMAEVFLAKQTGLEGFEKLVVIKRILPHLAENEEFLRMFLDEARTAADLRHANVVQIHEVGEDQGTYFLAMEFLHGQDLRRVLRKQVKQGGRVPLQHALQILIDAAAGLHYAHQKTDLQGRPLNIIHRDISPQNIIVTYEGTTKIVDFGIAKAASQSTETRSGVLKGKYSYMSPEQAAGESIDQRSDQFALGIVAYEVTTSRRLFKYSNEVMTLHAIIECMVPPPVEVLRGFPPVLNDIIMRALSRKRTDRFPDLAAMATAIEEFIAQERMAHSQQRVSAYMHELFAEVIEQEAELGHPVLLDDTRDSPLPDAESEKATRRMRPGDMSADHSSPTRLDPTADSDERDTVVEATRPSDYFARSGNVTASTYIYTDSKDSVAAASASAPAPASGPKAPRPAPRAWGKPVALIAATLLLAILGAWALAATLTTPKSAPLPELSSVLLLSTPPGARVHLDGRDTGLSTPCKLHLTVGGSHRARFTHPGHVDFSTAFDVVPGQTEVRASLERAAPQRTPVVTPETAWPARADAGAPPQAPPDRRALIEIDTRPSGAEIHVDGKLVGTAPVRDLALRAGGHALKVVGPNGIVLSRAFSVRAGERSRKIIDIPVSKEQGPGTLRLKLKAEPTHVYLDGKKIGSTPLAPQVLPPGAYRLRLVNDELHKDLTIPIKIEAGKETEIAPGW